ncbi:MAG TPA: hypothetical protein VGL88_05485 [Pseudonocardiaceae bacterium]|jgi:hypothetical protein
MTSQDEPQDQSPPADADSDLGAPVPNRRERRGGKSGASVHRGGKSTIPRGSGPVTPSRQYSTRRRSG